MKINYGISTAILNCCQTPQKNVYLAMHTCYSPSPVLDSKLGESECGEIIVKKLLAGNRGHFSPFEAATITIGLHGVPHSVMQQLLRSRIGVSPSVQSFRYSLSAAAENLEDIEKLIYIRPIGFYQTRDGKKFQYNEDMRNEDIEIVKYMFARVQKRIAQGMPDEQVRGLLPFDYRQNITLTLNARSLMSILDRRLKKDAQHEIQVLAELIFNIFKNWMPEVGQWYQENRAGKAMLAP